MIFFERLIVDPLLRLLLLLAAALGDLGLAVIILTVWVKVLLSPLTYVAHRQEDRLRQISARVKRETAGLKDLQAQSEAIQRIYQTENFKPLKNFALQLVPVPLLLALITVFAKIKDTSAQTLFLNLINLKQPNVVIGGLVLVVQLLALWTQPAETRRLGLMIVAMVGVLLFTLPSIFTLYWLVTTIISLIERKLFHWYEVQFVVKPVGKDHSDLSQSRR